MQRKDLLAETESYRQHVLDNGYGLTKVVEAQNHQIPILALELVSLGVDPRSVKEASRGRTGITFSMPGPNGAIRDVTVQFLNAQIGPRIPFQANVPPLDLGDDHFDAVYLKAGEKLSGVLSAVLDQASPHLEPRTLLVLNNLKQHYPVGSNRPSAVKMAGHNTTFLRSFWSEDSSYGNEFNLYLVEREPMKDVRPVHRLIWAGSILDALARPLIRDVLMEVGMVPHTPGFRTFERRLYWLFTLGVAPVLETIALLAILGPLGTSQEAVALVGILFSLGHIDFVLDLVRYLRGDRRVRGGELLARFVYRAVGGMLFAFLLTLPKGFDISWSSHVVLNAAVLSLNALGKSERMAQFPLIAHVLKKLLPFSMASPGGEIAPSSHSPVPQVISWRADTPSDPVGVTSELSRELSSVLLGGVPGPVWFGFNGLERRYEINFQQPQNVREFRFFLGETLSRVPEISQTFPFNKNLNPDSEIQERETVDLARSNSNFRNALAHWALAEMLLASSGRLGWLTLDYWKARWLERRLLGEMAKRKGAARMQRAAQAVALLRAAGASLSDSSRVDGNAENQTRDIEILLSAAGASGLSPGETIERPYNDVLRGVGIQDLWRVLAESHRDVSSVSASKALSVPSTVYFNVDALLDRGANARVVADALRGQLQSRRREAEKNRLVLITSKPNLLRSWGAQTEAELVSRWAIEWSRSYGSGFLSITGFALLHEGSSGLQEKLISSIDVVSSDGKITSVRSIRLSALQTHSKQMGTSVFEFWTDDPNRVDKGTMEAHGVVNILKVAEAFEKALNAVRFLSISA
jgi:hypothetical protein